MAKAAFITDIHFSVRNGSLYFIERYKLFFDKIFFPYLVENNIKKVFILGDTWEDRKNLNINSLREAREMFFDRLEQLGIEVVAILGNHDVFFRNSNETNSMNIIESSYSNIHIVDEYEEVMIGDKVIGLMSWVHRDNLDRCVDIIKNKSNAHMLCGHFEIKNFEMTKGNYAEHGFDQEMFARFNHVKSGHFHIESQIGNIHYIGNPFQTNWDDFGMSRGFHIYDSETDEFKMIKNTFTNYDVLIYSDEDIPDVDSFDYSQYNGKIVKVLVNQISDLNQLNYLKFLDLLDEQVHAYTIVEVDIAELDSPEIIELKSNTEVINDYVSALSIEDDQKVEVSKILIDLHSLALSMRDE